MCSDFAKNAKLPFRNIVPNFVPVGFDYWLANGGGNYIAPSFSTFGLEWYGIADGHWHGTKVSADCTHV
eukprot:SAG31_NODE_2617_length_5370_cov_10.481503_4_plen_69_part_00